MMPDAPVPGFRPSSVPVPDTDEEDPRVGSLFGRRVREGAAPRAALLGFPSDEGVRRNGGRGGAADAPDAIRAALFRFTPDAESPTAFAELLARTVDLGNLETTGAVEDDQARLAGVLAPLLAAGVVPVVLGGGHETSLGHFLGHAGTGERVGILNWDAHPDVRPLRNGRGHSGSLFRQALEHPSGACAGYTVAGLLPHSVAAAHLEWLGERGGEWIWGRDLCVERIDSLYGSPGVPRMVSFDMDAVDAAWAPGVSAPAAGGLDPGLWLHAAYRAGRSPHVRSMDLVEVNPRYDLDGRTARLAALTVWHFWRGLAERSR